jgi:hypothetical protein
MGTITPIIPAPARLRTAAGQFRLGAGATIAYRDPILAPLARRFAQDTVRRCGIALRAVPLDDGERGPAIAIDLGDAPDLAGLPAPLGLDPAGPPRDERYALTVDRSGIRLRAREPAGVARGLTSSPRQRQRQRPRPRPRQRQRPATQHYCRRWTSWTPRGSLGVASPSTWCAGSSRRPRSGR